MRFIDIELAGETYRAKLLDALAPQATDAIWDALPLEGQVGPGQWSAAIFHMIQAAFTTTPTDPGVSYQYPGLLMLEPRSRQLSICFGQGRLNDQTGPLTPIPIAEIGGNLPALAKFGHSLQWVGIQPIRVRPSRDQEAPLSLDTPIGPKIEVELNGVRVTATLLEAQAPGVVRSFLQQLPLLGRGTNTYASGPLTRFWNPDGGPEGETILEPDDSDPRQQLLYPGYIYYQPNPPWRGFRIARAATMMRSALGGGSALRLIPLAKLDGDWSAFHDEAELLLVHGAKPLSFRLITGGAS